jgi:hypothetical protein
MSAKEATSLAMIDILAPLTKGATKREYKEDTTGATYPGENCIETLRTVPFFDNPDGRGVKRDCH